MPVPRKTKWGAVNVLLHWAVYGLLLVQTVTGFLLYLGHGGWWVTIDSFTATGVLIYIVAHSISHFGYGGLQRLLACSGRRRWWDEGDALAAVPIAASVGSVVAASLVLADYGTLDELQIRAIPASEARSSTASWMRGCGGPRAQLPCAPCRASASAASASRRSRSVPCTRQEHLFRLPLGGPEPVAPPPALDQEGGRLAHPRQQPGHGRRHDLLRGQVRGAVLALRRFRQRRVDPYGRTSRSATSRRREPARLPLHHRRLDPRHVAVEGLRGGLLGYVDDMYIAAPTNRRMEAAGRARYQGGYWGDPGVPSYTYNFKIEPGHKGPAPVQRLPKDLAANAADTAGLGYGSGQHRSRELPLVDGAETRAIPIAGARCQDPARHRHPGVIIPFDNTEDRGHVHGGAKWKDGHWTLETVRALDTGSKFDIPFVVGKDLFMWVSVFDHTQTRHTRHMRPVRIVMH